MEDTKTFFKHALLAASNSTCVSHKVGAVAVRDGRIVATGRNGTPSGYVNCDAMFPCYNPGIDRDRHHDFSEHCEIHAEQNLIIWAARKGIPLEGCDIYVTHQPCHQCLKMLCNLGVHDIHYLNAYDKADYTPDVYDMLLACDVALIHDGECEACKIK